MTKEEILNDSVVTIIDIKGSVKDLITICNNVTNFKVMGVTNRMEDGDKIEVISEFSKGKLKYSLATDDARFNIVSNRFVFIENKELVIKVLQDGSAIIEDVIIVYPNNITFNEVSKLVPATAIQKDSAEVPYSGMTNFIKLYKEKKFENSFKL